MITTWGGLHNFVWAGCLMDTSPKTRFLNKTCFLFYWIFLVGTMGDIFMDFWNFCLSIVFTPSYSVFTNDNVSIIYSRYYHITQQDLNSAYRKRSYYVDDTKWMSYVRPVKILHTLSHGKNKSIAKFRKIKY